MKNKMLTNTVVGVAAGVVKVGMQIILLPIMARLLGPAEFGLYALALPAVSLCLVLAEGGFGSSLARENEANIRIWSTAFWVLLIVCLFLAAIVIALGYILAILSSQPNVFMIMLILSMCMPLLALSILPLARLTRRGNLISTSIGDLIAVLIAGLVSFVMAYNGGGAISLAVQMVVSFGLRALIFNCLAFAIPSFCFDIKQLRSHILFGGTLVGSKFLEFSGRGIENIIMERFLGASGLGAFSLSNQISRFACDAIGNPLWASVFAHSVSADQSKISGFVSKIIAGLSSIALPAAGASIMLIPLFLTSLLGEKWGGTENIIFFLLPAYAINTIASQMLAVIMARGSSSEVFTINLFVAMSRVLSVGSLVYWGADVIAASIFMAYIAVMYLTLFLAPASILISKNYLARVFTISLLMSALMVAVLSLFKKLVDPGAAVSWLLFATAGLVLMLTLLYFNFRAPNRLPST